VWDEGGVRGIAFLFSNMPGPPCPRCEGAATAVMRRPRDGQLSCRECFFTAFEEEVHATIVGPPAMFSRGDVVAVGASGGKDSTVLAYVLDLLNRRHDYGLDLRLLSVDEGISGYRDDSLETVKRNEVQYGIPLTIVSYEDLYEGWTMDRVVSKVGRKGNCTYCGVFRRQALEKGAALLGATKICTGHNADDVAETVILNFLRGDYPRLRRTAQEAGVGMVTRDEKDVEAERGSPLSLPRVKPFRYTVEKEIVLYAYFKKLDYFSTECTYSPSAHRGYAREFVKEVERLRPSAVLDLAKAPEVLRFNRAQDRRSLPPRTCARCGHVASQPLCTACVLLDGLKEMDGAEGDGARSGGRKRTPTPVSHAPAW